MVGSVYKMAHKSEITTRVKAHGLVKKGGQPYHLSEVLVWIIKCLP